MEEKEIIMTIANTTYIVRVHYDDDSTFTLKDRIIQMIKDIKYRK